MYKRTVLDFNEITIQAVTSVLIKTFFFKKLHCDKCFTRDSCGSFTSVVGNFLIKNDVRVKLNSWSSFLQPVVNKIKVKSHLLSVAVVKD